MEQINRLPVSGDFSETLNQNNNYPYLSGVYLPEDFLVVKDIHMATPKYEEYLRELLFRMYLIDMKDPLEFTCEYNQYNLIGTDDYQVYFTTEGKLSQEQQATYEVSTWGGNIFYNFLEDITYIQLPLTIKSY